MTTDHPTPTDDERRYAEFDLEERIVIYDRESERTWVQSDSAVDLAEVR